MFVVNYPMSLTIKLFPLLLENFIANPHMLVIGFWVKISLTAWAWCQVHLISLDESISPKVRPEPSSSALPQGRNDLSRHFIIIPSIIFLVIVLPTSTFLWERSVVAAVLSG
jgi:hypothetical protein